MMKRDQKSACFRRFVGCQEAQWNFLWGMKKFYILTVVQVTLEYIPVKIHLIVYLGSVHTIICKCHVPL